MDCLNFDGFLNQWGYGMCWHNGSSQLAHRVAYTEARGLPIESIKGKVVRHTCDNPTCVNPEHLLIGTQQDNMDDKMRRGRHVSSRGVANGRAVLTVEDVHSIRARYVRGSSTDGTTAIARDYGLHNGTIGRIVRGEYWSHV